MKKILKAWIVGSEVHFYGERDSIPDHWIRARWLDQPADANTEEVDVDQRVSKMGDDLALAMNALIRIKNNPTADSANIADVRNRWTDWAKSVALKALQELGVE